MHYPLSDFEDEGTTTAAVTEERLVCLGEVWAGGCPMAMRAAVWEVLRAGLHRQRTMPFRFRCELLQ